MNGKWKYIVTFILLLICLCNTNRIQAASYPANETEFYDYLTKIGKGVINTSGQRANYKTYQQYNLIVYGDRHGTLRAGSYCGNVAEFRDLGYNEYGNVVSNKCFINDATGSSPDEWKFIKVDSSESSWRRMDDSDQFNYTNNVLLQGNGAKNLNVHKLGGRPYGRVEVAPTWKSAGSIYTEHQNSNGSVWYATFTVPPMVAGSAIETNISTDNDTYIISNTENKVEGQMAVTSSAKLSGYAKKDHITRITSEFKGKQTTDRYTDRVWHRQAITFSRSGFSKPGTFNVVLEAKGSLETKFGDKDQDVATKKVKVIVEPYLEAEVLAEATASPERQVIEGDKATITVNVKGTVKDAAGDIQSWTFLAKKSEANSYISRVVNSKKTSESVNFTFTVPKEMVKNGTYKQIFDTKVRVNRKAADKEDADRTHAYVMPKDSEEPPPPPPPETKPPSSGCDPNDPTCAPDQEYAPPVASVFAQDSYFWPETVEAQNNSYHPDPRSKIVEHAWSFDNQRAESGTKKFSRVTEPEQHTVTIKVLDDHTLSDVASKTFSILPTKPVADFAIGGHKKENRAISLDAKPSEGKTPSVHVAPIDYTKTEWHIVPLTPGVDPKGIMIRPTTNKQKLEFLVREAGDYEATVTVTNKFGETSDPVSKEFTVLEDAAPEAKFAVDTKTAYRDGTSKEAQIELTDLSTSPDGDTIKERIYYVEFDSNNDGFVGTKLDSPKQVIASGNLASVLYKTNKVGNYRFSMEIKEGFAEPTLPEFISDEHYQKDQSNNLHGAGDTAFYLEDKNFNIHDTDKVVEVDNTPPVVDFGMFRRNKVDVVLNYAGLDTATPQHLTGKAPNDGQYDHQYFTYDEVSKNAMTALSGKLQSNLAAKGIDAKISFDNKYYKVLDADGVGIRNIPQWGWTYWQTYDYQNVYDQPSGYSPPSGWVIDSSTPKKQTQTIKRYGQGRPSAGSDWRYVREVIGQASDAVEVGASSVSYTVYASTPSQEPPTGAYENWPYESRRWYQSSSDCSKTDPKTKGCIEYKTVWGSSSWWLRAIYHDFERTVYDHRLKKTNYHQRWEIQYYYDQGVNSIEQVNTTDFASAYNSQTYRTDAKRHYIRMDKEAWNWMGDTTKVNMVANKTKTEDVFLYNMAVVSNRANADQIFLKSSRIGKFQSYDPFILSKNVSDVENFLINAYGLKQNGEELTVLIGDRIDYTVTYQDNENDPEIKREWKFTHDKTEVNGRVIDNQADTEISENNKWLNDPLQLSKPGTYKVNLRSLDDPVHWKDQRFFNYRKWSDEEVPKEYTVHVHRPPVANFTFKIDPYKGYELMLDPTLSYDPDHQVNRSDKGIVKHEWMSYTVDGVTHEGKPPTQLQPNKIYDVTLQVEDIDGAYASVTKRINTGDNVPPVADFTLQDVVSTKTKLDIQDLSYDPNGDELDNYQITVRKQGESTILKTFSEWPTSFNDMGLGEGTYVMGLTVWDVPRKGPSLQSEIHEEQVKVMNNNPPLSRFTLAPKPLELGTVATYTDTSIDPDNHNPLKYSWKVEKLDSNGDVLETWETGVAPTDFRDFGGSGTYRIYQTVWDSPPFPLESLSDTTVQHIEVIKGPDRPFALFSWYPEVIYATDTFTLDPIDSYDLDGDIVGYQWKIQAPTGTVTSSTEMFPKISRAVEGVYTVELHVTDDDGLKSLVPEIRKITVLPKPPNEPPVATFVWEPFEPFLGKSISFNPDSSYDPSKGGKIVSWAWEFTSVDGKKTTSTERYPSLLAASPSYQVKLTVTDNEGATGSTTQQVNVHIANLKASVKHTTEWQKLWEEEGKDPHTRVFRAGEKFVIELTSTPANRVFGTVDFGGKVGKVDIPSGAFKLMKNEPFEMLWRAELWREDFKYIEEGEYLFRFNSLHPISLPSVTAEDTFMIEIEGNVFDILGFHRNY